MAGSKRKHRPGKRRRGEPFDEATTADYQAHDDADLPAFDDEGTGSVPGDSAVTKLYEPDRQLSAMRASPRDPGRAAPPGMPTQLSGPAARRKQVPTTERIPPGMAQLAQRRSAQVKRVSPPVSPARPRPAPPVSPAPRPAPPVSPAPRPAPPVAKPSPRPAAKPEPLPAESAPVEPLAPLAFIPKRTDEPAALPVFSDPRRDDGESGETFAALRTIESVRAPFSRLRRRRDGEPKRSRGLALVIGAGGLLGVLVVTAVVAAGLALAVAAGFRAGIAPGWSAVFASAVGLLVVLAGALSMWLFRVRHWSAAVPGMVAVLALALAVVWTLRIGLPLGFATQGLARLELDGSAGQVRALIASARHSAASLFASPLVVALWAAEATLFGYLSARIALARARG